ncbi:MAG: hypothetical protein AAGG48_05380 [Planctomycetota bacterium]
MPLVKLWNSLRRRSKEDSAVESSSIEKSDVSRMEPTAKSAPKRRFFGGGPHAGLCKQLKGLDVLTVLEVSVGDGSRALSVVSTLTRKKPTDSIRYIAIDEFELGDGEIGLRDFFRSLRENEIQPKLFPNDIEGGLRRVANTIGAVDLVLIAAAKDQWQTPTTLALLSRISHTKTVILFDDGESWTRYADADSQPRRRAA